MKGTPVLTHSSPFTIHCLWAQNTPAARLEQGKGSEWECEMDTGSVLERTDSLDTLSQSRQGLRRKMCANRLQNLVPPPKEA